MRLVQQSSNLVVLLLSGAGETQSEGGFAPNRVSAASILDINTTTDKKGKEYYTYEILTRTGKNMWQAGMMAELCAHVAGSCYPNISSAYLILTCGWYLSPPCAQPTVTRVAATS